MILTRSGETPMNAPILCQIRTDCATGSQLVATIHTRLNSSLEDVRQLLTTLASRARGEVSNNCEVEVLDKPVNVTPHELDKIMSYPLHSFEFNTDFSFVRCGGCIPVQRRHEKKTLLINMFPRLPRTWGVSSVTGWVIEPQPPLVKILTHPGEHVPFREAFSVLFVSQGKPKNLETEKIFIERLTLQQWSYGRPYQLKELQSLVNHWNCNVKDCFGRTVLHECIYLDAKEAVAYLLSLPFIRINEHDAQGKTPLHIAVKGGNEFIVSRLIQTGAHILAVDNCGNTALHIALTLRRNSIVELLCRKLRVNGIPVNELSKYKNNLGLSPIDIFRLYYPTFLQLCEEGNISALKSRFSHYFFLPEYLNEHDELLQQSALHVAAAAGHDNVIKLLIDEMGISISDDKNLLNSRMQTPLHLAVGNGHFEVVKLLYKWCPKWLSMQDITGATPLISALLRFRKIASISSSKASSVWKIIKYLLSSTQSGAVSPNICDNNGMSALHLICELGMEEFVDSLIDNHGANISLCYSGNVGLTGECYLKKTYILPQFLRSTKAILERQKRVEKQQQERGITPLQCSIRSNQCNINIIQKLLSHGAGKRKDEADELIFYLVKNGHNGIADQFFKSTMVNLIYDNKLLIQFCELKHSIGIRWCIEQGYCKLNSTEGGCPLVVSASLGDIDSVDFLLGHGADPDIITGNNSPLHVAIIAGHDSVVESLVRAGARIISSDGSWSALHTAAENGRISVVRAILGLHALPSSEVSKALIYTMKGMRERNRAICEETCIHLASFLDFTVYEYKHHPLEFLHLAASRSLFTVVGVLVDRLLALPTSTLCELLNNAPPPPKRIYESILYRTVPREVKTTRIVRHKFQDRLYKPPKCFMRLKIQKRGDGELLHRLQMRDVLSYCAESNQLELLNKLIFDIGVKPWPGPDQSGWNAADYAVKKKSCDAVRMFIVVGLIPLRFHNVGYISQLGSLCRSMTGVNLNNNEVDFLSIILCKLIAEQEITLVKQLLYDICRHHNISELNGAGEWLDELVLCCVRNRCEDLLSYLKNEFKVNLVQCLQKFPQALLFTVIHSDIKLASYLIHQGLTVNVTAIIPAIKVKDLRKLSQEKREVSPLWLAARLHDIPMIELLLSTGPLIPNICTDDKTHCRDALKALIDGVSYSSTEQYDALISRAVVMMARAGHVFSSPIIIRNAAKKGMVQTVINLVDCYGTRIIAEDIVSDDICLLHYLVSQKKLCDVLRSFLVTENNKLNAVEVQEDIKSKILELHFRVNPVDYALKKGCTEGVLLLLGLGLCGNKEESKGCNPKISRLMHLYATRREEQYKSYTILHAAVELQYYEIADKILNEIINLQNIENYSMITKRGDSTPSLAALMSYYFDSSYLRSTYSSLYSYYLSTPLSLKIISPFDIPYLVFGSYSCEDKYREVVKRSASNNGLERALKLFHGDFPINFISNLMCRNKKSFYFDNNLFGIVELTPMCCALVAGNLPWVRMMALSGVSTVNSDSFVSEISRKKLSRRNFIPSSSPLSLSSSQTNSTIISSSETLNKKTEVMEDSNLKESVYPIIFKPQRYHVTPITLSMVILMKSVSSRDTSQIMQQFEIIKFLLSCDRCLRREEVNILAIISAELKMWDIFKCIIEAAKRLQDDTTQSRFFLTIKDSEILPIFKRVIGTSRHVIHKAARCAPSEILILIAKHSERTDIEKSIDSKGRTAFYHSIFHSSGVALEFLVNLGVRTDKPCCKKTGRTPLMISCQYGKLSFVELLIKKNAINSKDSKGNTPLLLAAASGKFEIVKYLLSKGADPSVRNSLGMTAVMVAALSGHDDVAVPLAENFSSIDDFSNSERTILHCAAIGGSWRVAESVLNNDQSLDLLAKDAEGLTAIYLAHAMGNVRVLRSFLNVALRRHITLSSSASSSSSLSLERQIFECSSKLTHYGWLTEVLELGQALLDEARHHSSSEFFLRPGEIMYGMTKHFGGDKESLLLWCTRNNNVTGIRALGDMNISDDCDALHEAAKLGHLDIIKLLLELKMSNPNKPDHADRLPFEIAALHNHITCALTLLECTKLEVRQFQVITPDRSAMNFFHRISFAGACEILIPLMDEFQKQSGVNWPSIASQLLNLMENPNSTGMTVFEVAIAVGNPAGVLRVAQTLQRLKEDAVRENGLTISHTIIINLPIISPSVRVLLYDFFNVPDVAMCAGFGTKSSGSLSFADVRLIGINTLRENTFCAPIVLDIFTLKHEINIVKSLLEELPFGIRYKPQTFHGKTETEQVRFYQWLTSSLILSNYKELNREDIPIRTVEIELVSDRSEEFVELSEGQLKHSIYMETHRLLLPEFNRKLDFVEKRELSDLQGEVRKLCGSLTKKMQGLSHPSLARGEVSVEWGEITLTKEVIARLINNGLSRVDDFLSGNLKDCLNDIKAADIASVKSEFEGNFISSTIRFKYTKRALQKRPMYLSNDECIILFNNHMIQDVNYVLYSTLYKNIIGDANLVDISFIRDAFETDISNIINQEMGEKELRFKLEIEGNALHDVPLHLIKTMMSDTVMALKSLIINHQNDLQAFHSSCIISNSLLRSLKTIIVFFSPNRPPLVERIEEKLKLCFNINLAPTRSEIYECLRNSTVAIEIKKLEARLPRLISNINQDLKSRLPESSLIVDFASILKGQDEEFIISALSILCDKQGTHVLQPLIDGVSIGWDTELGDVIRRHVRQVMLVLEISGNATCVLHKNGNFIYSCPLHCVERGLYGTSSWHLLSSQQIASLLLIQIATFNSSIPSLIKTNAAFACQSKAVCNRIMDAGSVNGLVKIKTYNILNDKVKCQLGETLTFIGKWHSLQHKLKSNEVQFNVPKRSGYYYQYININGKPIFNSPLHVRVKPLDIYLPNTKIYSKFNTVVVGQPFHILLGLRDKYGNKIEKYTNVEIEITNTDMVNIISWKRICADKINVKVLVKNVCDQCTIPILLLSTERRSFLLNFTVESISQMTYNHLRRLRGYTLGMTGNGKGNANSTTTNNNNNNNNNNIITRSKGYDRVKYFFRKVVRKNERIRLAREAKAIGGISGRVFPPINKEIET